MKRIFYFLLPFFSLQLLTAQIPNNDFENWDAQPVLLNWETNSHPLTLPPYDPYIVKQDTDRYSGSYAANFYGNGFLKPFAKTTFAVAFHPVALEARIKYNFPPCVNDNGFSQQDTISIVVELLNNGTVVDAGKWQYQSAGFLSSYQLLSIPVSQNSGVFDSCRITITGGNVFGGCGFAPASTQFKVDHLELKYSFSTDCIDTAQICTTCPCIALYDPVCGCNGVTYGNSCEAYNAGVTSWTSGVCGQSNDSCNLTGIVLQGTECLLVQDFQSNTLLMPCSLPTGASLHLGDTVAYSYTAGNCMSFCMQGTYVDFTCFEVLWASDTIAPAGSCHAAFSFSKSTDTVSFINTSTAASITNYLWDFGDGGSSTLANPVHVYAHDSTYTVCLYITGFDSSGNPCTDQFCLAVYITHGCIDTSLICPPGSLCCDAPLYDPVCGCDSVTYDNACVAYLLNGVTHSTSGPCITGINEINTVLKNLSLLPNPATDHTELQFDLLRASRVVIQVTDMLGAVVAETNAGTLAAGKIRLPIPVHHLPAGIYLLKVNVNGTVTGVKKLIKD
jgi:hypothetical protein